MKHISKFIAILALLISTSCAHMPITHNVVSKHTSTSILSETDTPPQAKDVLERYLSASGKHCTRYLNFDNIIETACLNAEKTAWLRLTLFDREN